MADSQTQTSPSLCPRPRPAAALHHIAQFSPRFCLPFSLRARHDFLIEDVAFRYVLQRERRRRRHHHCHRQCRPLPLSKVSHDVLLFLLPSLPSPDPLGSLDHATLAVLFSAMQYGSIKSTESLKMVI